MKIVSKFTGSGAIFFEANTDNLSAGGIEVFDQLIEGDFGSAIVKAFLQDDLILHYTFNRFVRPTDFIVSVDTDLVVNTLIMNSETGVWESDFEPYILSPNDVFANQLLLKGELAFRAPERIELFRIFARPEYYAAVLENYGDEFKDIIARIQNRALGNIFQESLPVSPKMKTLVKDILNYKLTNKSIGRNYIRNKTLDIIHLQLEQIIAKTEIQINSRINIPDKEKMQEAQKILKLNFKTPPTIKHLASMLATNEYKLKSGFHQLYNVSIYQYVINLRIEKSIELMYNENISLEEISDLVGYASLPNFTRAFKKVKGIPPSVFRAAR
jgi:AraC-like DNA-binding protein